MAKKWLIIAGHYNENRSVECNKKCGKWTLAYLGKWKYGINGLD